MQQPVVHEAIGRQATPSVPKAQVAESKVQKPKVQKARAPRSKAKKAALPEPTDQQAEVEQPPVDQPPVHRGRRMEDYEVRLIEALTQEGIGSIPATDGGTQQPWSDDYHLS